MVVLPGIGFEGASFGLPMGSAGTTGAAPLGRTAGGVLTAGVATIVELPQVLQVSQPHPLELWENSLLNKPWRALQGSPQVSQGATWIGWQVSHLAGLQVLHLTGLQVSHFTG